MTLSPALIIWLLALVCFGLATVQVKSPVNLIALGLFLLTLGKVI